MVMNPIPHPYAAYKRSGIRWLGDMPAYWELAQLKGVVTNV